MSKSKKSPKTEIPDREVVALVDRKCWTVRLKPCEPKVLGKHLPHGLVVMHNDGPGGIHIRTGYSNVDEVLLAGDTQIMLVRDQIELAIIGPEPATFEFEYMVLQK